MEIFTYHIFADIGIITSGNITEAVSLRSQPSDDGAQSNISHEDTIELERPSDSMYVLKMRECTFI